MPFHLCCGTSVPTAKISKLLFKDSVAAIIVQDLEGNESTNSDHIEEENPIKIWLDLALKET